MSVYEGNKILTLASFKRILENVPKDVEIHFSAFSEPFVNQEAHEMVKYASEQGYQIVVYTTTVGLDVYKLKDIKFKEFNVHDIGKTQNVPYRTSETKVLEPISRAGNLFKIGRKGGDLRCRIGNFDTNVMLPNGDVVLCCMDYGLKHKLGNLFDTNFNDLKREEHYDLCRECERSY